MGRIDDVVWRARAPRHVASRIRAAPLCHPAPDSCRGDDRPGLRGNKQLVTDFYRHVFDALNPAAVKDFVAEDYNQHCRHMPQGRTGLESIVTRIAGGTAPLPVQPDLKHPPAFLVAEGDMVVIGGGLPQPDPERPGEFYNYFIVDTFRVRDGRLAEHWSSTNKIASPKHPG